MLAVLLSTLLTATSVRAHEVQPGVMDIEFRGETLHIFLDWMIEAPVAGVDLSEITDTNASDREEEYLRLRALEPPKMEAAFRDAWPRLREKLTLQSGDATLTPEILSVTIPEAGNIELTRISSIELSAPLPPGIEPVVIGWAAELGPLVVRQRTIENGYAGYLAPGQLTDPIPRVGGDDQGAIAAFADYILVGFDHIVPKGLDHILFVLGLFFLSLRLGPLLWQVSAFTLAHTVTLALGAMDIIRIPADIVEPLIAASIVYVGIENVVMRRLAPWRPVVVFGFGLLHGLGFDSVLSDFGLGASHFVPKLIGFNVGVEIGQLAVIATAWIALALIFGRFAWFFRRISAPVSIAISLIAALWVLERTGMIGTDGAFAPFSALTEGGLPPLWVLIFGLGAAAVLSALTVLLFAIDEMRDWAGMATSFLLFLSVVAAFTSGAWVFTAGLTAAWVLALRVQSLGGPQEEDL